MSETTDGAPRRRSALLVFTRSVLLLQAFTALFATLVTWGLSRTDMVDAPAGWIWGVGLFVVLGLGYASGQQKKSWGRILGWVLQAPMLLAGFVVPAIAVMGAVFLVIWIMALRIGSRIDRERAEWDAQAAAEARDRGEGEDAQ